MVSLGSIGTMVSGAGASVPDARSIHPVPKITTQHRHWDDNTVYEPAGTPQQRDQAAHQTLSGSSPTERPSSGRSTVHEPGARYASVSGAPSSSGRILQRVSINPSNPASKSLKYKYFYNHFILHKIIPGEIQRMIEFRGRGQCLLWRGGLCAASPHS